MGKGFGLEELREVFKDTSTHIAIAKITNIVMADDRSYLKVLVSVFPEQREIVGKMSWEAVGPSSGMFFFPSINDMVLVAFADGDNEHCFVIKRLTSLEDKIPLQAVSGDAAIVSLSGKKVWISSDSRINISKGSSQPTENLVLGQQLKTLLSYILSELADQADKLKTLSTDIAAHTHIGNLGYPTSTPSNTGPFTTAAGNFDTKKTNFNTKKSSPVDDSVILSDIAFTEKGTP